MKGSFLFLFLWFLLSLSSSAQSLAEKLSPELTAVLKKGPENTVIKILVQVKDSALLKKDPGVSILYCYRNTALLTLSISSAKSLLQNPNTQFISAWHQPKEELTTGAFDLTLNKINLVHNRFAGDNGDGVLVSVKEQRFDSTDIDWKGRYVNTGTAAATESSHASIMATIIGGGGNSSPYAKGVAWGSLLSSSDFTTLLPDPIAVYRSNNIHLQNHSYGTGIENFYGADAAAYDVSVYSNPALIHVFSAGNSGTVTSTSGPYAGVPQFANLTGSFKMAKNILTVGHVDSVNNVLPLSSRGPAYDGRLKPDLVAYGEDGSSGAAALVSGTVALLQQAYKEMHNNNYPSAALVKATLLNSADDVGVKGPDFLSGYGSLNAFAAMQATKAALFFEDSVEKGGAKTFSIKVPANCRQLKITLAWTDTAAPVNATKALVNDLDALLEFSGNQWRPWVLHKKAVADSLLLPAFRATDTVNNVEQITVDDPEAGDYRLQISGAKMATATQAFAVAFNTDTAASFLWTYPTSSDVLKAGARNYLRWQTNVSGTGLLDYSTDGNTWRTLSATVDLNKAFFIWNVPDTLTKALLRMTVTQPFTQVLSDSFVVSPQLKLNVGFNCIDSFLLYWKKLPATRYQLYRLGNKYLEPSLSTTDTFSVFQKQASPSLYYAVAPLAGARPGLKSYTINYQTQGTGCYVESFYSLLQNNNSALLTATLGTLFQVADIQFQKWTGTGFTTIQTVTPTSLSQSATDTHLAEGINRYRVQVKLTNGSLVYSDEDQVLYFPRQPVIVFPNPAPQYSPVNLIVKDQGIYSIKLYDANGKLLKAIDLNDIRNNIQLSNLSKGIYFIQVTNKAARLFTQKLVVY